LDRSRYTQHRIDTLCIPTATPGFGVAGPGGVGPMKMRGLVSQIGKLRPMKFEIARLRGDRY
jgi:hypothetical protein